MFAYDIRNRDKILSGDRFRTGFGHCFAEKFANLAAFIALHDLHDEGRYVHNSHSWVLFTIMKIWDDAPKELHRATDIGMWNIGNLLSRETDHWNRPSVRFRKPRITINASLNNRGGFSLTWHPAAEDFSGDRLMTMGGYSGRPSNEIFYFQDFREAMWMVKSEHEKPWDRALRGHLLALFHEMLKEIFEIAARHCDVTVDNRLELIRDNKTELPTNWEIVGLRELETRKQMAEYRKDSQTLKWRTEEKKRHEARYKMTSEKFLTFVQEHRAKKVTFERIEQLLTEQFGYEKNPDGVKLMTEVKRLEKLVKEISIMEAKVRGSAFHH